MATTMTRDELKMALVNHGIDTESSSKKDDLVALYEEHVAPSEVIKGDFSCDDEEEIALSNLKKSAKKKHATPGSKKLLTEDNSFIIGDFDVTQLTDDQLSEALIERGIEVGPIVESTRKFYRKKLALSIREDSVNGSNTQNGNDNEEVDHDKEVELQNGEFSADDEEVNGKASEEEESQPSVVVKKAKTPLTPKTTSPLTSLRQRFLGSADTTDTKTERFTPTPRRSIHSYKVTETTKQTLTKNKDGTISHDFDYKKETSEDKGLLAGSQGKLATLLRILPGFFLILIALALAYYVYTNRK